MTQLAIKGHPTRGSEVIAWLEMLGGKNNHYLSCVRHTCIYFINDNNDIEVLKLCQDDETFVIFTLEEFEEKFPYKVGDKVITKDKFIGTITDIRWQGDSFFVGKEKGDIVYTVQVATCVQITYQKEDLQPYKEETMENKLDLLQQLKDYFDNTPREVVEKEWHDYDKYNEITPTVNEYLEYVNKIRQPKYPKTYVECAKILDCFSAAYIDGYKNALLEKLQELLICRDAYWKIAGDWKPNWTKWDERKYCIVNTEGNIVEWVQKTTNKILAFPTKEMRDAFYENFKELIVNCKDLL